MTRDPRASAMSEDQLMEAIRALVRDLGLLAFHAADSRRSWGRGYPDLTIVGRQALEEYVASLGGGDAPAA